MKPQVRTGPYFGHQAKRRNQHRNPIQLRRLSSMKKHSNSLLSWSVPTSQWSCHDLLCLHIFFALWLNSLDLVFLTCRAVLDHGVWTYWRLTETCQPVCIENPVFFVWHVWGMQAAGQQRRWRRTDRPTDRRTDGPTEQASKQANKQTNKQRNKQPPTTTTRRKIITRTKTTKTRTIKTKSKNKNNNKSESTVQEAEET